MDLSKIPLFEMLTRRMSWLSQRQEVLAHNIANADTPDFAARELAPLDFRRSLRDTGTVTATRTHAAHLGGGAQPQPFRDAAQRGRYETSPSGNGVVLEEQLMKVAGRRWITSWSRTSTAKHIDMIKVALGLSELSVGRSPRPCSRRADR
jgi:flagellar basal-body rod protein FlgB